LVDPSTLEFALERATDDPGARPAFYQLLMASHVFALVDARPGAEAWPSSLIAWVRDDNIHVIPFFSSVSTLPPARQPGLGVVRMPVRSLLEATRGMHLHLNPRSAFGREFTPDEITSLMASGTIHSGVHTHSLPEDTELQINQLAVLLPAIETALTTLLLALSEVNCCYLVEVTRWEAGAPTVKCAVRRCSAILNGRFAAWFCNDPPTAVGRFLPVTSRWTGRRGADSCRLVLLIKYIGVRTSVSAPLHAADRAHAYPIRSRTVRPRSIRGRSAFNCCSVKPCLKALYCQRTNFSNRPAFVVFSSSIILCCRASLWAATERLLGVALRGPRTCSPSFLAS